MAFALTETITIVSIFNVESMPPDAPPQAQVVFKSANGEQTIRTISRDEAATLSLGQTLTLTIQ